MPTDAMPNIDELQRFLDEIEALAPTYEQTAGTRVSYRAIDPDEVIDDSLQPEEFPQEETIPVSSPIPTTDEQSIEVKDFQAVQSGPIVAVDCGIVRLGETENGQVIALRATIVLIKDEQTQISLFRTGAIYLHNQHKKELLHQIGKQLANLINSSRSTKPIPRILG